MRLLKSPNTWSCLLYSFAMALDESPARLIQEIGHDGSATMFPGLGDPWQRQGFHLQELIDRCLHRSISATVIEALPVSESRGLRVVLPNKDRFEKHLASRPGVLIGDDLKTQRPHAVAWDGCKTYDPKGIVSPGVGIRVQSFVRLDKLK